MIGWGERNADYYDRYDFLRKVISNLNHHKNLRSTFTH